VDIHTPYRCTVRKTQRSRLLRPLIHHQMPHSIPLLLSHLQDPPNMNITWPVFGGAGWDVEVKGQSYGNGTSGTVCTTNRHCSGAVSYERARRDLLRPRRPLFRCRCGLRSSLCKCITPPIHTCAVHRFMHCTVAARPNMHEYMILHTRHEVYSTCSSSPVRIHTFLHILYPAS
jgi:hypothetical protein